MQQTTLSPQDWIAIFDRIAADSAAARDAMAPGFGAVRAALAGVDEEATIDCVFRTAGEALAGSGNGGLAPLLAAMWTGAAKCFPGRATFGAEEAVWMLESMEEAAGRDHSGESAAVLEALRPALRAAQQARGEEMQEILRRAAAAAAREAIDARTASFALLLGSLFEAVRERIAHGGTSM
jgi:hypothetical protein